MPGDSSTTRSERAGRANLRRAIVATSFGPPSVLELQRLPTLGPGAGEVAITVAASGVEFADVLRRRGVFEGGPEPPFIPGVEAAGVVAAVGRRVDTLMVGQRVVALTTGGAYTDLAIAAARFTFPLPDQVDVESAAAALLPGITAVHLIRQVAHVRPGETVVVLAAAGGVGGVLVQLCRLAGAASVIGVVGSPDKRATAEARGCNAVVVLTEARLSERVLELTGGRGADVVFDSVGARSAAESAAALAPFGRLVAFGEASGPWPSIDVTPMYIANQSILGYGGGPYRARYPARTRRAGAEVLQLFAEGRLDVGIDRRFPLAEAEAAHAYMESGATRGRLVLLA